MSDLVEIFVTEIAEEVTLNVTPNLIEVNVIKGVAPTNPITGLTTTGNSGAATLTGSTLNVPNYTLAGLGGLGGSGTVNRIPKFTGASTLGNSLIFDNGTNVGIGTTAPLNRLHINNGGLYLSAVQGNDIGGNIFGFNDTSRGFTFEGGLRFQTFNFNGTYAMRDAMTILGTGNVGIGTTAPTSRLHVTGLPSFADNAAALSGGLTVGAFYHTAGVLKVVI
jgi:hypothetical protein